MSCESYYGQILRYVTTFLAETIHRIPELRPVRVRQIKWILVPVM